MLSSNNKISIRQLQILLILNIFGTGIITIPRRAAEYAQQDAWVCVVIAAGFAVLYTYIITTLGRMFSRHTFTEYSGIILSRPIGILLSIVFAVKLIINTSLELRIFGEMVRQSMLEYTPFWVVCMAMTVISAYAAVKGYETRARVSEMLIFIVFVPILLLFVIAAKQADFTNLMPVMITSPHNLLFGGFVNTIAFTGIELCMLAPCYINKPQNLRKGACRAVAIVGVFMVVSTIMTISQFGYFSVQNQLWPMLEMLDTINLPGGFIERQEALVMSFFIISVFAVVNAGLFFAGSLSKDVIKKGKRSYHVLACGAGAFILSMIPDNIVQVFDLMDMVFFYFGIPFMIIIPLLLLIAAKMRGLGDKLV